MSRAKFEEWARSKGYDLDKWDGDFESLLTLTAHEGWLAGRESMRDEAAETCQTMADGWDDVAEEFGMRLSERAIRKIEP